jgi:hypothetical protein
VAVDLALNALRRPSSGVTARDMNGLPHQRVEEFETSWADRFIT